MTNPTQPPLRLTGHNHLPTRLLLSTLTGRSIRISDIRPSSTTNPGLKPHEVSLIRLLDTITNGAVIEFSMTGTTLLYKPGLITGSAAGYNTSTAGGVVTHSIPADCAARGLSYWLLPLCILAPFSKNAINVLFTGPGVVTSAHPESGDPSVDTVRTAILPLFRHFGIQLNLELRVQRRCSPSAAGTMLNSAGGEVQLVFGHQVRLPKTLHLLRAGRVKRVRGVAYATGVPGSSNARSIDAARGVLNRFVPDTYIFSDVTGAPPPLEKGQRGGRKTGIGYGMSLVAETTSGCFYSADTVADPRGGQVPEEVGKMAAYQLLEAIEQGGCVDKVGAGTMLILMAMGSEDVGRIAMGRDLLGSPGVIALARELKTFGMSEWGLRDADGGAESDSEDSEAEVESDIMVTVVGKGVGNVGRKIA
ncbi:MAG: hypothetical protein Q9162_005019 [Coniocarpon cinnabarinum]